MHLRVISWKITEKYFEWQGIIMAQRRRRKYGYKFTEKTQSKKGIASFFLAVLSIAILFM